MDLADKSDFYVDYEEVCMVRHSLAPLRYKGSLSDIVLDLHFNRAVWPCCPQKTVVRIFVAALHLRLFRVRFSTSLVLLVRYLFCSCITSATCHSFTAPSLTPVVVLIMAGIH